MCMHLGRSRFTQLRIYGFADDSIDVYCWRLMSISCGLVLLFDCYCVLYSWCVVFSWIRMSSMICRSNLWTMWALWVCTQAHGQVGQADVSGEQVGWDRQVLISPSHVCLRWSCHKVPLIHPSNQNTHIKHWQFVFGSLLKWWFFEKLDLCRFWKHGFAFSGNIP